MFPVEVVYFPLEGLGSDEVDGDEGQAKAEAMHYIDGAIESAERIAGESGGGDVLVFMPSERDIKGRPARSSPGASGIGTWCRRLAD